MKTLFNFAAIAAAAIALTACNSSQNSGNSASSAGSPETVELKSYSYSVISENPQETVDVANGSQFTLNKGTAVLPEKIGSNDISALKAELRDVSGLTVTDGKITPTLPKNNTLTDKPDTVKALGQEMVDLSVATVTPSLMVFKVYTYSYLPAALNGSTKELYVNYYIPENKVLKLSDLIKSGSEQAMLTAVQSSLTSHYSYLPPE